MSLATHLAILDKSQDKGINILQLRKNESIHSCILFSNPHFSQSKHLLNTLQYSGSFKCNVEIIFVISACSLITKCQVNHRQEYSACSLVSAEQTATQGLVENNFYIAVLVIRYLDD